MISFVLAFFVSIQVLAETPRKIVSPYIKGDVLYIAGKIDSHIYDYLTYPNSQMSNVKMVNLDSWGGNHDWAIAIAEKIQQRGWNTYLPEDQHCASACVYLFGAGSQRVAHSSTWFGIHGARMGAGYMVTFAQNCLDGEVLLQNETCSDLETKNYELNFESTRQAFSLLEASGVSASLWETYMELEDDPQWFLNFNFLKKPDWVLPADTAIDHALVTQLEKG